METPYRNHNWLIRITVLTRMSQIFWVLAALDVFSRLDATTISEHVLFFDVKIHGAKILVEIIFFNEIPAGNLT